MKTIFITLLIVLGICVLAVIGPIIWLILAGAGVTITGAIFVYIIYTLVKMERNDVKNK